MRITGLDKINSLKFGSGGLFYSMSSIEYKFDAKKQGGGEGVKTGFNGLLLPQSKNTTV